jgi:hypothetical protein
MSETIEQENTIPVDAAAPVAEVEAAPAEVAPAEVVVEEISYHAVEKNGTITAIWEMRGRKHLRTIDPRSAEGRHLLGHPEVPESSDAAAG